MPGGGGSGAGAAAAGAAAAAAAAGRAAMAAAMAGAVTSDASAHTPPALTLFGIMASAISVSLILLKHGGLSYLAYRLYTLLGNLVFPAPSTPQPEFSPSDSTRDMVKRELIYNGYWISAWVCTILHLTGALTMTTDPQFAVEFQNTGPCMLHLSITVHLGCAMMALMVVQNASKVAELAATLPSSSERISWTCREIYHQIKLLCEDSVLTWRMSAHPATRADLTLSAFARSRNSRRRTAPTASATEICCRYHERDPNDQASEQPMRTACLVQQQYVDKLLKIAPDQADFELYSQIASHRDNLHRRSQRIWKQNRWQQVTMLVVPEEVTQKWEGTQQFAQILDDPVNKGRVANYLPLLLPESIRKRWEGDS